MKENKAVNKSLNFHEPHLEYRVYVTGKVSKVKVRMVKGVSAVEAQRYPFCGRSVPGHIKGDDAVFEFPMSPSNKNHFFRKKHFWQSESPGCAQKREVWLTFIRNSHQITDGALERRGQKLDFPTQTMWVSFYFINSIK